MNEIGMPVDGRRGVGRGKMVSTWGARDIEKERERERESKRSCQNQTRRRRSGYLAYLIGTRNESMKQVRTHGDPSLFTTFPKRNRIETLPSPGSNRICHNLDGTKRKKTSSLITI